MNYLERYFGFGRHRTTLPRDSFAGMTTFVVMSYIIFVNPIILTSVKGPDGKTLPFDGVLASTCLVACVMTILMGVYTNRAYALAPGLGINAIVAFTLVGTLHLSFPSAMGLIVLEGLVVTALVLTGLRETIMRAIPLELKKAIAIGIGLFIAFIGFYNSGLVVKAASPDVPVTLARLTTWPVLVTVFGLALTIALRALRFRGDLLVGIVATTALATLINELHDDKALPVGAQLPTHVVEHPNFSLLGNFDFHAFSHIGGVGGTAAVVSALAWVFTLFLSDFFDTMGTLVGVGKQAGYLDEKGELPEIRKPLLVDSVAAIAGGAASASSATTYIESGAGVAAGGRTGWVSVVCGALFFPFMFFAPVIGMVPPQATAPALILVGWMMISTLAEYEDEADADGGTKRRRAFAGIDFHDVAIGIPAALVIMVMPFTWNITNGIGFGFIAYVLIRLFQGRWRVVHPLMAVVSLAFAVYFVIPLLQDHFSWI
ncbi:MAG: adenine/guanine/hypoxanthine permease [Gaiellaceae bacterium]|jgi:AGZA family xanthine/uracil permease-like MFS transporter|nr:adenine/guanine/hypoxanthine permease [Gaiellaceae bacterium]